MIMIRIDNVTVLRGNKKLFENFSFEIRRGEHWVIQGKNGSGKTTLLQLIAGSLTPFDGSVHHSFIEGTDWDARYRKRQETIHFVPPLWLQSALSGTTDRFYQQRYYSIDETGIPTVSDIFGEDLPALKSITFSGNFDIHRLLDLHVTRLSNGQLKKVVILRQLVKNIPKVLILDYPFDGLDADSRRDLAAFIDDIARRFDIQIILSDHGTSLPPIINRRLVLDKFQIAETSIIQAEPFRPVDPPTSSADVPYGEPIVEMKDLTIQYGSKKIISNLNWRVNRGERWALTGKNGSGKTTLFSLIFADHPMAYSQKVFLFGKRRGSGESIWDIKNRINYLGPEQIHFLDDLSGSITAREYLAGKENQRIDDLINFFHAHSYMEIPMRSLSSGQLQMVLLMNMFLDNKELLLLDEPFQFLDPENHALVTSHLNHFLDDKVTLILITHDERDVERWTRFRKVM